MKRRDALKTIGGLAGAATVARVLPACGGGGDSGPDGITTYVFMMMENRSYDHFFGSRSFKEGLAGNGPRADVTLPDVNGKPIGLWAPTMDQECDPDPPHGWDAQHASWNHGACDQFVVQHQMDHMDPTMIHPMQYLTRDMVPVSYALADQYAICDKWFCSVMGPTWPNRFYWFAGTSFGIQSNQLPANGVFSGQSIFHKLEAKQVPWAYYYGSIPVVSVINDIPGIMDHIHRFTQFATDAAAGKLPAVVYIDPAFNDNDDHPPVHPINGQELIASVYATLAASPQWKNIMLVITYDENGGFYDHVSPPTTTDTSAPGFDQLGFRVPTLVVGPYVKENYVSTVQYDHTSCLAHLINVFGLDPLTPHVTAAHDLTDLIDMERLAKFDWKPPIQVPAVDPSAWPMPPVCSSATSRTAPPSHPVLDWADAHPELVAGLDLRGEIPAYRQAIREGLAKLRR